jgi:NADH dehydrogenase/NADH:ubiquinone oxidoreductase subunit G
MKEIRATLNNFSVNVRDGVTILEAAREHGIYIPTLCYRTELSPIGACRICVVEVTGSRTLVAACHTPVTEGMIVNTHSPTVLATRRIILRLLLASHCGTCYMCAKANMCELRHLAAELDVGLPGFELRRRYYPTEDVSPYLVRDLSKCILCRRCVRACTEIARHSFFAIGYRGFYSKIVVDLDKPINKDACRDCDVCVSLCPTGALSKPCQLPYEKKGRPLIIRS